LIPKKPNDTSWKLMQGISDCENDRKSDVHTECCRNQWLIWMLYIPTTWPVRIGGCRVRVVKDDPRGVPGCGIIHWHQQYRARTFINQSYNPCDVIGLLFPTRQEDQGCTVLLCRLSVRHCTCQLRAPKSGMVSLLAGDVHQKFLANKERYPPSPLSNLTCQISQPRRP
jgi:hypothetical protein